MNDPATFSHVSAPMDLSLEARPAPPEADLERRVDRLEEEVGALKDTRALEERVVERVTDRLQKSTGQFSAASPPAAARGTRPFADDRPAPRGSHAWLFVDMLSDARLICRMLWDRRYAQAWTTHLVVWLFVPAILTSGWWFPLAYVPFFGPYFDKALDLLLAFCVYKALGREARRYAEMLGLRR